MGEYAVRVRGSGRAAPCEGARGGWWRVSLVSGCSIVRMRIVVAAAVAAAVGCAQLVVGEAGLRIVGGTLVTDATKYPYLATLRQANNFAYVVQGVLWMGK